MSIPKMGSVGFHPTFLPAGRGRAPLAWVALDNGPAAANFFLINDGVDAGPIFVQEPVEVTPDDYVSDIAERLDVAIKKALDRWLPELLSGKWDPKPQSEVLATWNGRRGPDDGLIDWHRSADEIHALIRATSEPHPGAYVWYQDRRLIVWRGDIERRLPWRGAVGRVLLTEAGRGVLVQTGEGLLWLTEVQFADADLRERAEDVLRVGVKLSFVEQDEIAALRARVASLEKRLEEIEQRSQAQASEASPFRASPSETGSRDKH